MNNFKIEIYNYDLTVWDDYTNNAVFPLKIANMLDERLAEAELTLKRAKTQYFTPNSIVRLTIINKPSAKYSDAEAIKARAETETDIAFNNNHITETKTIYMAVANDNAIESPIGSGRFDHQLYLIEITKVAEGFIGDSITTTNALGNTYTAANFEKVYKLTVEFKELTNTGLITFSAPFVVLTNDVRSATIGAKAWGWYKVKKSVVPSMLKVEKEGRGYRISLKDTETIKKDETVKIEFELQSRWG